MKNNNEIVYNPSDIMKILKLSKGKLYQFLEEVWQNQTPFKVIKIGKLYKIPKDSFNRWLYE